ncbi:MAG: TetR/AcrR family transcriptional regulator [Pseudomonadota bacterium]
MTDTRERFIEAAIPVFAERGFYGASIAAIANALPFSKQALLHHFGSKERLYGEVLARISTSLMATLDSTAADNETASIKATFQKILDYSLDYPDSTTLLMRELLDNRRRASSAHVWHLKPFLETLTRTVEDQIPQPVSRSSALCFCYQILGAINYYAVSGPTLAGIYGTAAHRKIKSGYPTQLGVLIDAGLSAIKGT